MVVPQIPKRVDRSAAAIKRIARGRFDPFTIDQELVLPLDHKEGLVFVLVLMRRRSAARRRDLDQGCRLAHRSSLA